MASMIHRTSFALDEPTIRKMKDLARRWGVSQAEVLRRLVSDASAKAGDKGDPMRRLRQYHARGGLARAKADAYVRENNRNRAEWSRGR